VFVLWGNYAKTKKQLILKSPVLTAPHPSPFSAHYGFFGSRPFSRINDILQKRKQKGINWGDQDD